MLTKEIKSDIDSARSRSLHASSRWGEPVKDFVQAVECHAEVRRLDKTNAYWVCAYANNQHKLDAEIPDDPKQSAFFKAMQLCEVSSASSADPLCYDAAAQ